MLRKTQWAMGNVESVSKSSKISGFLTETGRKNIFGKNYHNTPLNRMVFHRLLHFEAYCTDRTQIDAVCLPKNPKNEIFNACNSPKKNSQQPNVWNMIDCEPVVVFMQKLGESDQ